MLEWPAIAVACGAAGGLLGGAAKWLYDRGFGESKIVTQSNETAVQIGSVIMQITDLRSAFHTHQLDDARAFGELRALAVANREEQIAAERRVAQALETLTNEMRYIGQRIDRIIEGRGG